MAAPAKKYGSTIKQIREWNKIDSSIRFMLVRI
ncbi:LysM peptidoglycan-binding domain-containing protein [Cytobacillus sp. FSL W7-1323]